MMACGKLLEVDEAKAKGSVMLKQHRSSTVREMAMYALIGVPVLFGVTVVAGSLALVFKGYRAAVDSVKSLA
jgi:hypothetical protein